jgi:hypothetical protein
MATLCKSNGCRYPASHITSAHKCGKCGEFGHGQNECENDTLIRELHNPTMKMYRMFQEDVIKRDQMPLNMFCKNPKCNQKHTHSTESHQNEFEIHPVDRTFKLADSAANKYLTGRKGCYFMVQVGMGYINVYRNITGVIEKSMIDCMQSKEINEYTRGLVKIEHV